MKLRNKKTGEIADLSEGFIKDTYNGEMIQIKPVAISNKEGYVYGSLAELNKEWEDAPEEPKKQKKYWFINSGGETLSYYEEDEEPEDTEACKEIGNYFDTQEEAEKAVEKLKAWKRLKDKGFRFDGYNSDFEGIWVIYPNDTEGTWCLAEDEADLDLLFGGEE